MATGLEILGGVAAAVQLTQLMARFIKNFGTLQNTPRQVKRLERVLDDLNDVHLINAASPKERKRLWDLVLVAEQTLQRSMNEPPNRLLQFFWPEESEKRLKDQNDEIQSELITLGLRVDRRRWATSPHPFPDSHGIPLSPGGTVVSPPPYPTLEQPASQPPSRPQGQDRTILDPSASSPEKYKLPATLYLQSSAGTVVVGPLEVKYLRVLERDEETRLIHYERKTERHNLHVTHRIPRGCLRFEDDSLTDTEVHFLGTHPITVVRSGTGHQVYFLHAKYHFSSLAHREQFLAHMLERTLLGRFYAEEIRYNDQLHAQGKVIRLWKKTEGTRDAVKLTFLARGERQFEWDLGRLSRRVVMEEGGWVTLTECGAEGFSKEGAATVKIKFRQQEWEMESLRRQAKRRRSSVAAAAELQLSVGGNGADHPETKKGGSSPWSKLRRLSKSPGTGGAAKGKNRANSNSPSLKYVSEACPGRKSTGKLAEVEAVEGNDAVSIATTATGAGIGGGNAKPDAEVFRDVFQQFHPESVSSVFTPLPSIAVAKAWDPGDFEELGAGMVCGEADLCVGMGSG
ncbi:hypothetical protein B0T18DRAFT_420620 [Schizothecium vesticola]|uniref:Uncharacterized protein n=1 Tax=Schizothecium vesticola TaxID=314040 RepID=A0AA40BP93_9PEZI|nr:hypothetical protein B0T18DRAFT_420620 [Schizothecium vesticola]